ncbi:MAG: hypothetical protein ACK5H2_09110 [Beutenbergiaceae bacterium]
MRAVSNNEPEIPDQIHIPAPPSPSSAGSPQAASRPASRTEPPATRQTRRMANLLIGFSGCELLVIAAGVVISMIYDFDPVMVVIGVIVISAPVFYLLLMRAQRRNREELRGGQGPANTPDSGT